MRTSILGLALIATAGVAIGILMAPDKGSKTREKLAGKAGGLRKSLRNKIKNQTDKFDDIAEMLESEIEHVKRKVDKLSESLQKKVA